MIKKSLRLRSAEVEKVLKEGRSLRSAHMQVKILSAPGQLRSAAIVAKSVARKANKRNALRRAVYRAITTTPTPLPSGMVIFFLRLVPKHDVGNVIKEEVTFLLSQAGQAKLK